MATIELPARERVQRVEPMWQPRPGVLGWVTTTDHKRIGLLYFWTALVLFGFGGAEALTMRTQLAQPNRYVVGPATYDQLFTVHGVATIFFFIIAMTTGRVRELPDSADDRRARHGVPADERTELLDLPRVRALPLHRLRDGERSRRRLVRLRAADDARVRSRSRKGLLRARDHLQRDLVVARLRELHRDDVQDARARHVVQSAADVLLRVPRSFVRAAVRAPGSHRGEPLVPLEAALPPVLDDGDFAILASILRTEAYEVASYEFLVHAALALGVDGYAVRLLRLNMEQDAYAGEQAGDALVKLLAEKVESVYDPRKPTV